jgi:hypothetical protein
VIRAGAEHRPTDSVNGSTVAGTVVMNQPALPTEELNEMTEQRSWGKWMRVEVVTDRNAATADPKRTVEQIINLDHVARVIPAFGGTTFQLADGDHVETTTHFEIACAALMVSQGPRPPMTRDEVAAAEYDRQG